DGMPCRVSWEKEPSLETLSCVDAIMGQPHFRWMSEAPHLRWVQTTSAGVDHYFLRRDRLRTDVVFTNLSGAFGQAISEYVLTMCLMLYKSMHLYRDHQAAVLWHDEGRQESPVGKHLLILGSGDIGTAVASIFAPFGCRITGMRRSAGELPAPFGRTIRPDELDGALPDADIVVCALPHTPETVRMLDARRLSLFRKDAVLINVGRGAVIDQDALAACLQSGGIRGAALDVFEKEPLPEEHPLWKCANAIITPHITGGTFGLLPATEDRMFEICMEYLKRFLAGDPLLNIVDPESGYRRTEERFI
ncbi:MAG: D-2-hydroxyacid dehydrogenase, partial [Clostridia bacterium]|nr:D-2-hydroxyacid dehydrogenase [Clostridia bacterium]